MKRNFDDGFLKKQILRREMLLLVVLIYLYGAFIKNTTRLIVVDVFYSPSPENPALQSWDEWQEIARRVLQPPLRRYSG